MDSVVYLQLIGLIIVLVVVLTLSFYVIYPMVKGVERQKGTKANSPMVEDSDTEELSLDYSDSTEGIDDSEEPNQTTKQSAPVVSYKSEANEILADKNRVEDIVMKENQLMTGLHQLPDYRDDPSSIDLIELDSLRRDIRRMAKELSQVRRTNVELKDMVKELQKNHADALARISNTDLWAAEKQKWNREFEKAFREYEEYKLSLPLESEKKKDKK